MSSQSSIITYRDEKDVTAYLQEKFGVTREECVEITRQVVAARRNTTDNDVSTAEGTLSYIYGTRSMRDVFRAKGEWYNLRERGLEYVVNDERRIRILFQNVEEACSISRFPRAISDKGTASRNAVESSQRVFSFIEESSHSSNLSIGGELWYLCLSYDKKRGARSELSRPSHIKDGQFAGFLERIFLVEKNELDDVQIEDDFLLPEQDYDIQISRK